MRIFFSFSLGLWLWFAGPFWHVHGESVAGDLPSSFYRKAPSYSTAPEPDPPRYVVPATESNWGPIRDWDWLDIGLDYRFRGEFRDGDIRRDVDAADWPMLHRVRMYLGIREKLDPFRFALEFEDARRHNGQFPRDNRDFNQTELIRLYGELYFRDLLGYDSLGNPRPLSLRYGIHNFEFLDRRLIGNNQWRNTTNTFQGLHSTLGQKDNDWQLALLAVQPLERLIDQWDRPVEGQWMWAAIGDWRGWSDVITIQPFYLALTDSNAADGSRTVHSPGVRLYGPIGSSGFDYDVLGAVQFGNSGNLDIAAWALAAEIGYRFDLPWSPRLSLFYGQATGDRNPNDGTDNRFERFFGFARPWSANDSIIMENIRAPKLRLEAQPHEKFRFDTGISAYWLDSKSDRFLRNSIRDSTGGSGRYVGHEFDARFLWQASPKTQVILGYAHFVPGTFIRQQLRPGSTDFAYLEINLRVF